MAGTGASPATPKRGSRSGGSPGARRFGRLAKAEGWGARSRLVPLWPPHCDGRSGSRAAAVAAGAERQVGGLVTGGDDGGWATVRVSLACRACIDPGTRLSPPHGGHGCFTAALCMCSTLVDAGRSTPPPRRMTRAAAAVGATGVDRSSVTTRWAVRGGGWTLAPPAAAVASIFRPA